MRNSICLQFCFPEFSIEKEDSSAEDDRDVTDVTAFEVVQVVLHVLTLSSICLIYHFSKFTSLFRLTKWPCSTLKNDYLCISSLPASKINNLVIQITIQIVKQGLKF